MDQIRQFSDQIAHRFNPDRVILFGSYALGEATEDSDVDLLVVIDHQQKSWQMASEIRKQIRPVFPLDLLVRTPQQLRERLEMGDGFIEGIIQEGKVLYETSYQ